MADSPDSANLFVSFYNYTVRDCTNGCVMATFDTYQKAEWRCASLNMEAGAGGRYVIYDAKGTRVHLDPDEAL